MADLSHVGAKDGWRCWLYDKPVDPDASVNSDLGPSVDSIGADRGKKNNTGAVERLAHRQCNTMKGKKAPVVPWGADLFIADPAPIVETVERLQRKSGREAVGRCPSKQDAIQVQEWLLDRLSRLAQDTDFAVDLKEGGGQYLVTLRVA